MPQTRSIALTGLLALLLLPLAACANSPWASSLQRSLAADPRLQNNPALFGVSPSPSATAQPQTAQLPANFPAEIPRYPNAELVTVNQGSDQPDSQTETQWTTPDSATQVRQFYQQAFSSDGWQLAASSSPTSTADGTAPFVAERDGLQVTVQIPEAGTSQPSVSASPSPQSPGSAATETTEFAIAYAFGDTLTSSATASPSTTPEASVPQPGAPDFIGPVPPANWTGRSTDQPSAASSTPSNAATSQAFSDINQAPEELRSYVSDLAALGALKLSASNSSAATNQFKPNQPITRREFARWLVAANNLIYENTPARKIRLASSAAQPAFQDVSRSNPDFGVIQGLTEAGLIPSSLSGDPTKTTFRPDAPLTREDMILWKTPLDTRQSLPNATIDAVKQTWGFQDVSRIDPRALRAVLADYQNSDLSNIRRAFGYTTLFQPKKPVTRAEAAASLWYFGVQGEGVSAKDVLQDNQQPNGASSGGQATSSPQSTP